jgi:transposase
VKNVYEVKEIQRLYQEYGSIREVTRLTGISRNTVRKYLRRIEAVKLGSAKEVIVRKPVPFKRRTIEPRTVARIEELLDSNKDKPKNLQFTAKKIWQMVVKEGHKISYTSVKRIVRKWKEEHGQRDVYIIQKPDGKRAEFDWGEVELVIAGEKGKYPAAFMVLNRSLYRFSRVFERETAQEVIQAHIDFFEEIGGVPQEIFYDNMKVVKDRKNLNKNFVKFATFFGFTPRLCNPYSPQEKGTDEESVGFVRNWVFSERNEFDSLEEANEYLKEKLAELNASPVYGRELVPVKALNEEKLNALPTASYNNYRLEERIISRYSLIMLDGNYYSVPEDCPGKRVQLKIYPDRIEILKEGKVVAVHKRLRGKGKYAIQIAHYLNTLRKKPGALAGSRAFQALNDTLKVVFGKYYTTKPREFVQLLELLNDYDEKTFCEKIEELFENGIIPTADIMRNLLQQKPIQYETFDYPLKIQIDHGDPSEFDRLVGVHRG